MAGDILCSPRHRWLSSYSGYHWVMDYLAARVTRDALREEIDEIHELNFGVLDVPAFADADRREILLLLRNDLVPHTRREWSGPGIEHFEELAELAAAALRERS